MSNKETSEAHKAMARDLFFSSNLGKPKNL